MRLEGYAVIVNLAVVTQAEDLESPAICQNRPVPCHEAMQPAELLHTISPRPQVKMVGIGQDNLRSKVAQFVRRERLHRCLGTNRHEDGGFYHAMGGVKRPGACRPNFTLQGSFNFEMELRSSTVRWLHRHMNYLF